MDIFGVWMLSFFYLLVSNGATAAEIKNHESQSEVSQPSRTAFHFQPSKNWMNDPNGPMYYKGVYHLFYQFNPYGPLWGNISWGHSISYDLVNWVHLDIALVPSEPYDINGCFSGSVTFVQSGKPVILYTGDDSEGHQVQNLAVPKNFSDPLLREWIKSPHNPLLIPPKGIDPQSYRDPSTAWMGSDGEWRVVIGSEIDHRGSAILYKSTDFVRWTRNPNLLHSTNKTNMLECPDFYPVSVHGKKGLHTSAHGKNIRHVFKASFKSHDFYILGDYDLKTDKYVADTDFMDGKVSLKHDYGKFYASKSFYDSKKHRRILWSWINEGDGESNDIKKGWSSLQSVPRTIWLSEKGDRLVQWPVKELEQLRTSQVHFKNKELVSESIFEISGITASQADVEITFSLSNLNKAEVLTAEVGDPQLLCSQKNASVSGSFGPFGLSILASKDLNEHTAVFFRVFKVEDSFQVLMCADQSRSSLRSEVEKPIYGAFLDIDPHEAKISLRSLIDHSIIESFGGEGLACITSRVYPQLAIGEQARLYAFNNGTQSLNISSLSAYSMKKAQILPMGKRRKPIK